MSERLARFFASRFGTIVAGVAIGLLSSLLQRCSNPPNIGTCVTCFERDSAGAPRLRRARAVQCVRPEIVGLLRVTVAALLFRASRTEAGSAPIVCFRSSGFAAIGALVVAVVTTNLVLRSSFRLPFFRLVAHGTHLWTI